MRRRDRAQTVEGLALQLAAAFLPDTKARTDLPVALGRLEAQSIAANHDIPVPLW